MVIQSQTHKTNWLFLLESLILACKSVQQWASFANSPFLPLILSCKVVSLILSHPSGQPESWLFPILRCSTTPLPTQLDHECCRCVHCWFSRMFLPPCHSMPPRCLDPSYFSPERSQSLRASFSCPSSPFHRDDSKARTGTLFLLKMLKNCHRLQEKAWLCSIACLFLLFFFSHFPDIPSLLLLVHSLSLQGLGLMATHPWGCPSLS